MRNLPKNFQQDLIMREARTLAKLQLERRQLRAKLRSVDREIRYSARMLKKLTAPPWEESGAGSKVLNIKAGE